MAILKAPPVESKNETLQLRVSQDLKFRLMRYAEFIHANASYVPIIRFLPLNEIKPDTRAGPHEG
jgi:hypothetical protein